MRCEERRSTAAARRPQPAGESFRGGQGRQPTWSTRGASTAPQQSRQPTQNRTPARLHKPAPQTNSQPSHFPAPQTGLTSRFRLLNMAQWKSTASTSCAGSKPCCSSSCCRCRLPPASVAGAAASVAAEACIVGLVAPEGEGLVRQCARKGSICASSSSSDWQGEATSATAAVPAVGDGER